MDAKYETEPVVTPELQAAINTTGLAPDATWSQKVNALIGNGLTAPLDAAYAATVVNAPLVDYSANPAAAPEYAPAHLLGQPAPVSDRLAVAQAAAGLVPQPANGAAVTPAPEVVSSFQCAYCGKTLTFTVSAAKA